MAIEPTSVPDFDDLPKVEGMPQGCAWGLFDRDGHKDLVGTLNFLTPGVVKRAAAEVKEGFSISLNWPLNGNKSRLLPRKQPKHTLVFLPDVLEGLDASQQSWDDELEFNTQSSSQWDSLCHVHHQPSGLAYNGSRPDRQSLAAESTAENGLPTLDHWHARGAMVGRGVLIDYRAFADETGRPFNPIDGTAITVADVEACAAHFGVEFLPGDILLVRVGATEVLESPREQDREMLQAGVMSGLESSVAMARWMWNKRFAAAASDALALETFTTSGADAVEKLVLHQYMLGLFGMPIGELWDLRALAAHCHKVKRYSFMMTSVPLHHPCLIASPPNAVAIL